MGCMESRQKHREMGIIQSRKDFQVVMQSYDIYQIIEASDDPTNKMLPSRLLIHIFSFLDAESLNQVAQTSKYWCHLSNADEIWSSRFLKTWGQNWFDTYRQNKNDVSWKRAYKDKFDLEHNSDCSFKVLLAGTAGVGKTALMKRFVQNTFDEKYTPTPSLDLVNRGLRVGDTIVKLHVWDVGSRAYPRSKERVLKSIHGAIIVVDITSLKSLTSANDFIKDVNEAQVDTDLPIIIVGNKCDLDAEREFSKENVEEHVHKSSSLHYMEISAKTGQNIEEALSEICSEMIKQKKEEKLTDIAL